MQHIKFSLLGTLMLACVATLGLAADGVPDFIHLTPEQIAFQDSSEAGQAVLFGNPSKPGPYVIRVRFPPGVHSNPHYHSQDRHITVMQGVWYMGTGEHADISKAVPLKAGSYAFHPARGVHWDGAGAQETVVEIIGVGPVETVRIDPKQPPMSTWALPKN